MTRLSQIIAVEKGVKSDAARRYTDLHRNVQKDPLLSGIARTYRPRDDDGDQLPPESSRVQVRAQEALGEVAAILTRLMAVASFVRAFAIKASACSRLGGTRSRS